MTTELIKTVEDFKQTLNHFSEIQKEFIDEKKMKDYVNPLVEAKYDRVNEALTKAEEALDAAHHAQVLAKRVNIVENSQMSEKDRELRNAYLNYLRKGDDRISEKDREVLRMYTKSLTSGSDPAGGYTVMPQFDSEITRVLNETSPMRRVATVKTISTDQYEKLQRTDRASARWEDRDVAPTETDTPTFKKLTIKAWKMGAEPRISQDLLDDSFVDIELELRNAVVEEFELTENTAFINGDGVGQPRGILDYAAGTSWGQIEQVVSGNASALTYGGLIDLVYALKDGYLGRAAFMMKRSTVAAVRKILDGNNLPIWQPGFGSEPPTLLGYPIIRANDMPAISSNALAIAFGDFTRAYTIVDRIGTRVLVDPYTAKPFVKYYTTKRVGGAVDNFEAIKLQKIST